MFRPTPDILELGFITNILQELKRYCKCNKYNTPDQPLIQCTKLAHCGIWLHQACIIDNILLKKWAELCKADYHLKNKKGKIKSGDPPYDKNSVIIKGRPYRGYLEGKLLARDNQVEVTDLYNDTVTNAPIECMKCSCTFNQVACFAQGIRIAAPR